MNSMHNSFSGPGGYSGAYPGYVPPPSALPYYNGYPGDINQSSNPYYGKPGSSVPPGYSSGIATYTPPINNSSMYYQQYGLGYQYGYSKYSLGSSLGYSSELPTGPGIHPPSIGTLQAPTTDLGLTGSMFSKSSKFSGPQGSSSPHASGLSLSHGGNSTMLSPATPNTPSPGPHALSGSLRGAGATPSPPVDASDAKKDLDKMRRCQVCGQVFRLMSECLAHMKAVHEAPLSVYSLQHTAGGHVTQSLNAASGIPPHSLSGGLGPPSSRHGSMGTPDSPLMALERMGWGEKQNIMSSLQSSPSPLASSYTSAPTLAPNSQHLSSVQHHHQNAPSNQSQTSAQVYGPSHQHGISVPHQSSMLQSPVQHHSPSHHPSPVRHPSPAPSQLVGVNQHSGISSNQSSPAVSEANNSEPGYSQSSSTPVSAHPDLQQNSANLVEEPQAAAAKHRKTNSYSVSSIIGETRETLKEEGKTEDEDVINERCQVYGEEECMKVDNNKEVISPMNTNSDNTAGGSFPDENVKLEKCEYHPNEVSGVSTPVPEMHSNEVSDVSTPVSEMQSTAEEKNADNHDRVKVEDIGTFVKLSQSDNQITMGMPSPPPHEPTEEEYTKHNSELNREDSLKIKSEMEEEGIASPVLDENKDYVKEPQSVVASDQSDFKASDTSTREVEDPSQLDSYQQPKEEENQGNVSTAKLVMEKTPTPDEEETGELKKSITQNKQHAHSPEHFSQQDLQQSQLIDQRNQHPMQGEQQNLSQKQQPQHHHHHASPSQPHHQHPSPPVGMFHNQSALKQQSGYGGWPMSMGPGFSGQYPYPCPQNTNSQSSVGQQQLPPNALSGGNLCSKPHGYPPMHPRFPSQYHQPGVSSSGQFPPSHDHHVRGPGPHNFIQGHPQNHSQGHPQGNWFPPNPRTEAKPMWGNWPNQSGQPYPQGFYGYPGTNQPQGQKLHHHQQQQPPPAHVHPPQAAHMHSIQHQHMSQQQSPLQKPTPMPQHFQQQQAQQMQQQNLAQQQVHPQSVGHPRPTNNVAHSPHDQQKEHIQNLSSMSSPGQQQSYIESSPQPSIPPADNLQSDQIAPQSTNQTEKGVKLTASEIDSESYENQYESAPQVPVTQRASTPHSSLPSKKSGHKIGPKSKTMAAKQFSQVDDLDNYKCTITVQENGSLNGYASQESSGTGGHHSCDSSDSEMAVEDTPVFTMLKPVKRKYGNAGKDGVFIGPKRIKLAKQVRERQERRQRHLQEQIRQNELEEQLQAQRAEMASDHNGPLANILLQSSILLADNKVEGSESVEECIASIKAERQLSLSEACLDADGDKSNYSSHGGSNSGNKKSGRKSQNKVFHNENSVTIKDLSPMLPLRKLRAKDFKWSHYIKSMRYWCNDCGQGFKNQKEASIHSEDRCKWNCLYMLECYVVVNDIQTHPAYGPKVQELLEEYQVDGDHQCVTCSEIIARKADFLVHVDSHKDFMPWECTICGTRFKIRGSLKEHLRYTHMKGRVPCLKCNKVFPTSTLLRQHVKVHTQHYKYKSAKNREEELRAAMEATAGALEGPIGTTSPEDNEKLSHEANEYRNWCKLMEMNALKNLSTPGTMGGSSAGGSIGDEDEDEGRVGDGEGSASGEEVGGMGSGSIGENSCSEIPRNCMVNRSSSETKADMNS